MPFSSEQRLNIKESSELYAHEVTRINSLLENESDDSHCEKLYLLRAIATIEHTQRIGLLNNEEMTDKELEALTQEVNLYFPHKDDSELFDDIAILEDDIKARFFNNPAKEKQTLLTALGITLLIYIKRIPIFLQYFQPNMHHPYPIILLDRKRF